MKGKIIVVTHKDYEMPTEEIYFPICVGTGHYLKEKFQADDEGNNISHLNSTYCELTAIYWAWKNMLLDNIEYIGVSHYRRYMSTKKKGTSLSKVLKAKEIESLIGGDFDNKIIVPSQKKYFSSISNHYIKSLKGYNDIHKRDIERLMEAIHICSPEYDEYVRLILNGNKAHMLNMFIMGKNNYALYCEWLFEVINKVVELSNDRNDQNRYAGALAEFCLDIWVYKNRLEIIEVELLETEKLSLGQKSIIYLKRKILGDKK